MIFNFPSLNLESVHEPLRNLNFWESEDLAMESCFAETMDI
jgi:hypothetical protein